MEKKSVSVQFSTPKFLSNTNVGVFVFGVGRYDKPFLDICDKTESDLKYAARSHRLSSGRLARSLSIHTIFCDTLRTLQLYDAP